MQYDFVLRDVDPQIGPALAALAEILNDRGEGLMARADAVLSVEEQLEALAHLMERAMPLFHFYDQERGVAHAAPGQVDLFLPSARWTYFSNLPDADTDDEVGHSAWLVAIADVLRLEALRQLEHDDDDWGSNPLAAVIDFVRLSGETSAQSQLRGVSWLLDQLKPHFGVNAVDEPPTSPWVVATRALAQFSQAVDALLSEDEEHG